MLSKSSSNLPAGADIQHKWSKADGMQIAIQPLVVGGLALVASRFILPESVGARVDLPFVKNVSAGMVVAGTAAAASLLSQVAHDYILPSISRSQKFDSLSGLVSPASTGLANVLTW